LGNTASNLEASSGSPMTPVEARKICRSGSRRRRGELGGKLHGVLAGLAGEGVGVAGIDEQRAGLAALDALPGTNRPEPKAFRLSEHTATRVPSSSSASITRAPLVAHAGGAGGEAHAVDRRISVLFWEQAANRSGLGILKTSLELRVRMPTRSAPGARKSAPG